MSDSTQGEKKTQSEPVQQKLPLAFLHGKAVVDKPEDLYIPPDALEIILETFEAVSYTHLTLPTTPYV